MIRSFLEHRFGETFDAVDALEAHDGLQSMAARGSCRRFLDKTVDPGMIQALCALALSTPTKSDLQQRDIVLLDDPDQKAALCDLVEDQGWIRDAPYIAVYCGNNRRQRFLHDWTGHRFANDHLDAFFNATVDAGIALAGFVTAAEAAGLGCCPISAVRNRASEVSGLLDLPDHVFPVAGLGFGYPAQSDPAISLRLPLAVTVHQNTYKESDLRTQIDGYDARRRSVQPYSQQRSTDVFGHSAVYGWSEDKARQYALPERETFGDFVKSKGFKLK